MKQWKLVAAAVILAGLVFSVSGGFEAWSAADPGKRVAILIMASPGHPGSSVPLRIAMAYAVQLKRSGVGVRVLFEGAAVQWMAFLAEVPNVERGRHNKRLDLEQGRLQFHPEERVMLLRQYQALKAAGIPVGVSPLAAEYLDVKEELLARKVPLARSDDKGEINIAAYVAEGYQVWVF